MKHLTKAERHAVEDFAKLIRAGLGGCLIKIEIFGSKVRGDYTESSDIDILIIVKERTLDVMDRIGDIAAELTLEYNIPISPIVFSEHEYKVNADMSSSFILSVKAEGCRL
jgi:predicted nucleotidyltransferase